MLPDRVSSPELLTYESGALPIALRGPAEVSREVDISRARSAMIYSLTTDRQPVIYWATNPLLARIYFDSNT